MKYGWWYCGTDADGEPTFARKDASPDPADDKQHVEEATFYPPAPLVRPTSPSERHSQ